MKKTIYLIIFFSFIQSLISNLGHPVTPAFVRSLNIPDYMFGVFFSAMSLGLMIGGPIWGVLGDQGKKKKYIVFGILVYSFGQVCFAYVGNASLMVLFRFISGFGIVSAITLLTSYLIELSKPRDRARFLAYVAAAVTLGASFGYAIGGSLSSNPFISNLLGTSDYRLIFLIQAILNAAYALSIYLFLKETEPPVSLKPRNSILKDLKGITKIEPSLLIFLLSLALVTIGSTNINKYIDVYFDELGYTPLELGTFVMATGIASLLASVILVPIFAKFKKQLVLIGIVHILSALIVFYVFRSNTFLLTMYTVFMVYVILKAIYQPLEQNYISLHAKEGKYGSAMGIRQSFVSIGMVIGPLLGGFLYEKSPILLFDSSAFAFLLGVLLLGVVYLLERKKKKATEMSADSSRNG